MAGKKTELVEIEDKKEVVPPLPLSYTMNEFLKDDKAVGNLQSLFGMFMKKSRNDLWLQLTYKTLVVGVLIGAVVFLSYHDKFTSAVAFAVGTLSGVVLASNRE